MSEGLELSVRRSAERWALARHTAKVGERLSVGLVHSGPESNSENRSLASSARNKVRPDRANRLGPHCPSPVSLLRNLHRQHAQPWHFRPPSLHPLPRFPSCVLPKSLLRGPRPDLRHNLPRIWRFLSLRCPLCPPKPRG